MIHILSSFNIIMSLCIKNVLNKDGNQFYHAHVCIACYNFELLNINSAVSLYHLKNCLEEESFDMLPQDLKIALCKPQRLEISRGKALFSIP